MFRNKTLPARVKAADDGAEDGIVEALVATYDVDSSGDRIVPGAFTKSLASWQEQGQRIPFIWSHLHNDIDAYLGEVLEAKETDEGLWVKAQLDMEDEKARKAFRLIKGGRVRNYSFAYDVQDGGPDEEGPGERALRELHLYEVGPTLIGMNQNTRTLVAKNATETSAVSGEEKAGRVLSAKNESDLRSALDLITAVLSQLGQASDTTSQAKTSENGPATTQEPPKATVQEPSRATPVTTLAAHIQLMKMKGHAL